ncbi:MAG: hypothetical protein GY928_32300 [Colwellia sp.]|nr:hypothetical protein [Colwellia sp.]
MEQSNKYRKKPVVIEAFQFTETRAGYFALWPKWLRDAFNTGRVDNDNCSLWKSTSGQFFCGTLRYECEITFNDWIIQDDEGRIYPCKPDIFESTYEPV